jgi:ribonucleoside-diphosphate reductase alpha chain
VRHRPVGIGVQGLQDVFFELRLPFDSLKARALNRKIFETMYFAAVRTSCDLACHLGPHPSFQGSPASQGKLQHHLWGEEPTATGHLLDWAGLAADVVRHGLRNSLSIAPMPTASTSQLLGNTEAMEPITSNLYSRRTLAGEFAVLNRRLVRDLLNRGVWTSDLKDKIIARNGSVQQLAEVPDDLQALYKTAWELPMKALIDMAADRGPFVCQSQSLNLFVAEPTFKKLSSMHFYAWRRGLKTGCYYLRTRPAARAVQVTVNPRLEESTCVMCSS